MIVQTPRNTIYINVQPGIWLLDQCGGSGKTYLSKVLRDLTKVSRCNALCLTYDSTRTTEDYVLDISKSNADILVLDRFNLYNDSEIINAYELKSFKYVFIDYKNYFNEKPFRIDGYVSTILKEQELIIE